MAVSYTVAVDWENDGLYAPAWGSELITNGNFAGGTTGWSTYQTTLSVAAGVGRMVTDVGKTLGQINQSLSLALAKNSLMALSIDLGNSSAADKFLTFYLGAELIGFITVPAGSGLTTYTSQTRLSAADAAPVFYINDNGPANDPYLLIDNISVKRYQSEYDVITGYVIDARWSRGIYDILKRIADVGSLYLTLNNADRRFSPANTASPIAGYFKPNLPVRVQAYDGSTTFTLWSGFIRSFEPDTGSSGLKAYLRAEDRIGQLQATRFGLPLQIDRTSDFMLQMVLSEAEGTTSATSTPIFRGSPAPDTVFQILENTTLKKTYTFKTTLTPAENEILIGATAEATALNFFAAVNNDAETVGTSFASTTTRSDVVVAARPTAGTPATGGSVANATGGASMVLGESGGANYEAAVTIAVTGGLLSQFTITLDANTGTPSGTLTWYIFENGVDVIPYDKTKAYMTGTFTPTASAVNTVTVSGGKYLASGVLLITPTTPQTAGNAWNWTRGGSVLSGEAYTGIRDGVLTTTTTSAVYSLTTAATTTTNVELIDNARGDWGNDVWWRALSPEGAQTQSIYAVFNIPGGHALTGGTNSSYAGTVESGNQLFSMAADNWGQDTTSALDALTDLTISEWGLCYANPDGDIIFRNRDYEFEQHNGASSGTLTEQIAQSGSMVIDDIYNEIVISFEPRGTLTSGVIARARGPIKVSGASGMERWDGRISYPGAGTGFTRIPYVDQGTGRVVGAQNVITPVLATDYTLNEAYDGSSVNYTIDPRRPVYVSVVATGAGVEVSFLNKAQGPLYVRDLQVRGEALIAYDRQQVIRSDTSSITAYGRRTLSIFLPMPVDQAYAEALAGYLLNRYKDPVYRVRGFGVTLDDGSELVNAVNILGLDVLTLLSLTDNQTGITARQCMILSVDGSIMGSALHLNYRVVDFEAKTYWKLQDPVLGKLDNTTRLAL